MHAQISFVLRVLLNFHSLGGLGMLFLDVDGFGIRRTRLLGLV